MKIFFSDKEKIMSFFRRHYGRIALCCLVALVVVAQCRILFFPGVVPVESAGIVSGPEKSYIVLEASPEDGENLFVWINGEPRCGFSGGKAEIEIITNTVVEVFNSSRKNITVRVSEKSDVALIPDEPKAECGEGLTVICRCYCN